MTVSPPNLHKMVTRWTCIQDVLKVKVKVKGHVIRELSWILGMSYSVIDGLVIIIIAIIIIIIYEGVLTIDRCLLFLTPGSNDHRG